MSAYKNLSCGAAGTAIVPASGKGPASSGQEAAWFAADLLERFGRYTAIHTTSDLHGETCPSSPGQWDLARLLQA